MIQVYIQRIVVDSQNYDDTFIRWDVLLCSNHQILKSFSSKKNAISFCMENFYDLRGYLPEGRVYVDSSGKETYQDL